MALAVFLVTAIAPRTAAAERRVVILQFAGDPAAADFYEQVVDIVRERHEVISGETYRDATRKIRGYSGRNPDHVARAAQSLDADGIMGGIVERDRGDYILRVLIRAGKDGELTRGEIELVARSTRLSSRQRRRLRRRILDAIDDLPSLRDRRREDDFDDRRRDDDSDDRRRDDEFDDRRRDDDFDDRRRDDDFDDRRRDDDFDDGDRDRDRDRDFDDDDDQDEERRGAEDLGLSKAQLADLQARGRGLEISGGIAVSSRKLRFNYAAGLEDPPDGYESGAVPAAYVVADLYPMAFDLKNRGLGRNIGITAVVDKVLSIKTTVLDAMMTEVPLATEQLRYGAGLVYRVNFGSSPRDPTLKLSVRYNKLVFDIDKTQAPEGVVVDVPNVAYTYFDPGLGIRYPVSDKVAFLADARVLFATDAGEIQELEQYGAAKVTGFDGDGAIEIKVNPHLFVRAGGRYLLVAFDFHGNGALTDRDGNSEIDVAGAADSYLGGYATLGYKF